MNFWNSVWTNMSQLVGFLLAALSGVLLVHVREWYLGYQKKKNGHRNLRARVDLDQLIYQISSEARALLDADRVKVFQIINGSYYFGGISQQKMFLTHLTVKLGVGYPGGLLAAQSTLLISQMTALLQKCLDQPLVQMSVDEMVENPFLIQFFLMSGTHSVVCSPLYNNKKQCIGLLMATWLNEKSELSEEEETSFLDCSEQLSAAITTNH